MTAAATADLWWKNAVIYCLDVQTFADSNGDGVGDFAGLTQRVDYLAGLGITCIWLMPFYPTPDLDDGYDIEEYYAIDERLGTFGDFTEFMSVARHHGIRVIADLVVNHTSDRHRWFQSARRRRDSPFRDFYVWRDEIPEDGPTGLVFPGEQEGMWTWDAEAGQYYHHRFYHHQPDLNVASPAVRDEIAKVIGFWLAQGMSGFRVDAVPYLIELDANDESTDLAPHDYLRRLRAFMQRRRGDAVLLGEVNLPYDEQRPFFGDEHGDELTMLFDFPLMQATYLALARADIGPIVEAIGRRPAIPDDSMFASFLRNHDELTLDQLDDAERAEVFEAFGPDPDMQLFGRGLRRRVPPMFDDDADRIRMAYSLMFSFPGTPTLFYGEEIGMGENLAVEGRMAVRTPMQWDDDPAGGFTTAPPDATTRPFPDDHRHAPAAVNVHDQRSDPESLLNWFERLIRLRTELPEVGWGTHEVVDAGVASVFALRHDWEDRSLLTVHNLSSQPVVATVHVDHCDALRDLLNSRAEVPVDDGAVEIELTGYGYRWLRIAAGR